MFKSTMLSALALGIVLATCVPGAEAADDRPNIIIILVDDMGWSDLGCYGGEVRTPHLDELARSGLRFTQAYNTAKCFPSRACLLTGVYAQHCGMDQRPGKIRKAATLGEVLRPAGYRTLASGKHHSTENLFDRGFDHYYGLRDGCCNFWNPGAQRQGEPEPARKRTRTWCIDGQTLHPYTPDDPNFYTTDAFTDKALEWLDEPETRSRPFLLYLAYTAPHYPLHAWPEDIARYEGVYDVGYQAIQRARHRRQIEQGLIDPSITPLPEQDRPAPWEALSDDERAREVLRMQVYAAMLDRVDQNVGRLLDKLRAQGRLENTLILFASDNGGCAEERPRAKHASDALEDFGRVNSYPACGKDWALVQDTPLRKYKGYSHEGGICTPMIAYWPGKIEGPGGFVRQPVHFIDIMPTLVQITGADYPLMIHGQAVTPMQGVSLVPLFRGRPIDREQPLFFQFSRGGAVRDGDMKAVFWGDRHRRGDWALYDLARDRNEQHDLSAARPDVLERLVGRWERWYAAARARVDG